MSDADFERLLQVITTEQFEIDRDVAYLYVSATKGPDYAGIWIRSLAKLVLATPEFPGPRANAIDQEASEIYRYEVRRLLYYGPDKRRPMKTPYRVLYTIIEPEDSREGYIRILRLVHGSRPLILPEG